MCPMYKYAINSHETTTKPKASFSFCGFAMIIIIAIRTNKSCKNSIFSPCFDLFWNDNFIQPKLKFNHCVLYSAQRQRAKRRNDKKGDAGSEADSAVRSEITIAALLRGAAARKLDGERTSDAAEGGAIARKTMDGSTDGMIARISCSATNEVAHGSKRRHDDYKSSAAANEAARGYKFYHQPKLHSHLVTQIRF